MRIGLTAGDPAGIGLEVLVRSIPPFLGRAQWVLFGDASDFAQAVGRYGPDLPWSEWTGPPEPAATGLWFEATGASEAPLAQGAGSGESGRRALAALDGALVRARAGDLAGIVTAPLAKRHVGADFTGQTEHLRDGSGAGNVAMSFFTPTFKVVVATTHLSLREALDRLSVPLYTDLIELTNREIRALGYPPPRIAVSGINPHAGEGGLFGTEEADILTPAVSQAARSGIDVSGPWPADTCYQRASQGEFDVVVAPYHDQGLIPVKLVARGRSANVTLGLPFVRTSPDHGTAFDIAGRGIADTAGMESALEWALELVSRRSRADEADRSA